MKYMKTFETFETSNEELDWKKGLVTAAIGASTLFGNPAMSQNQGDNKIQNNDKITTMSQTVSSVDKISDFSKNNSTFNSIIKNKSFIKDAVSSGRGGGINVGSITDYKGGETKYANISFPNKGLNLSFKYESSSCEIFSKIEKDKYYDVAEYIKINYPDAEIGGIRDQRNTLVPLNSISISTTSPTDAIEITYLLLNQDTKWK